MKRRLQEKVNMYRLVQDTMKEYHSVWENVPKFVQIVESLNGYLASLQLETEQGRMYTFGVTANRDHYKKECNEAAYLIAKTLKAIAHETNNFELFAAMKIQKSTLQRATNFEYVIILDLIVRYMDEYSGALAEYGISSEKLEDFRTKRDNITSGVLSPKQAILKRKDMNVSVENTIKAIDTLLKHKLDGVIGLFEKDFPEFIRQYKDARRVTHVTYHRIDSSQSSENETQEPDDGPDPF